MLVRALCTVKMTASGRIWPHMRAAGRSRFAPRIGHYRDCRAKAGHSGNRVCAHGSESTDDPSHDQLDAVARPCVSGVADAQLASDSASTHVAVMAAVGVLVCRSAEMRAAASQSEPIGRGIIYRVRGTCHGTVL